MRLSRTLRERYGPWLLLWGMAALTPVQAQELPTGTLLAVSKPPLAVLKTDPPSSVWALKTDLSTATELFAASKGELRNVLSFEYVRLQDNDTAFLSFDVGETEDAPGGIVALPQLINDAEPNNDARFIRGPKTGLALPKGLVVDSDLGVVSVADFGANIVSGFDLRAEGDVAPLFTITDLGQTTSGSPRQPWGLELDIANQRLFVAATDGTILVFDDYLLEQGRRGPDRVIIPTSAAQDVSANLHGILYLPEADTLIVADFGPAKDSDEPGFDTDGKIFVIQQASRADGRTQVTAALGGPNSGLGNPSDLVWDGSALYVGEKALDAVLQFDDVLSLRGAVDPLPTRALTVTKPESLVIVPGVAP